MKEHAKRIATPFGMLFLTGWLMYLVMLSGPVFFFGLIKTFGMLGVAAYVAFWAVVLFAVYVAFFHGVRRYRHAVFWTALVVELLAIMFYFLNVAPK